MSRRVTRVFVIALIAVAAAASYVALGARAPRRTARLAAGGGEIHGYVAVDLTQWGGTGLRGGPLLFLPDITVYAKRSGTGTISPRITTDLGGFFMIPEQPAGAYQLCVEAPGYTPSCGQSFTIADELVTLPPATIVPQISFVAGSVLLADGQPCRFSDPAFRVDFDTKVTVEDGTPRPPVRANFAGNYLVPGITAAAFNVRADCEASSVTKPVVIVTGGGAAFAHLVLPNRPPGAVTIVASQGGRAVRAAAAGTTVELTAESEDVDPLQYTWVVSGSSAPFADRNADRAKWALPSNSGLHTVYVLVRDGRGGASLGRRNLASDASSLLFTGTVVDTAATVVEGAEVEISGVNAGSVSGRVLEKTTTNAAGGFMAAPRDRTDRYVLTIRKEGYQIFSKTLDAPATGGRYELLPVPRKTIDGTLGGWIIEDGDPHCGRESTRFTNPDVAGLAPAQRAEIWRTSRIRCGAQVFIPSGALVDASGRPFGGPVSAFVSSIDLRDPNGRFPGEYGGVAGGVEVALNSVGAVDVSLFDPSGAPLALAAGARATVRIPLDPLQLAMPGMPSLPPPGVPIWFYDSTTGLWNQEGFANLAGDYYETDVSHFSTINADLDFSTPACMRVRTDTSRIPIPYRVRVSVPAAAPAKVITETIDDPLSVLVLLPPNTDVKLEVLDSAGRVIPTATAVARTGATSSPAYPAYDYASCTSQVTLSLAVPKDGGFLDYFGYVHDALQADKYYEKIDPTASTGAGTVSSAGKAVTGAGTTFTGFIEPGHLIRAAGQVRTVDTVTAATTLTTEEAFNPALPAGTTFERVGVKHTLNAWKTANGFGADDEDAVYLNAADLGLGRWMHKKKDSGSGNIAYYVSNYGVPPAFGSVDIAALAKYSNNPNLGLIATVAMEYSPHPTGGGKYTKFYVFNNSGARVNKADLDGRGVKYIPGLCMVCHGGNPATVLTDSTGNANSRFIPFDAESFGYTKLDDPAAPGTFPLSRANQEPEFKAMNRGVRDDTNVAAAITELIEGWYGGAALPNPAQNDLYVHKGWRLTGTGSPAGTSPVDKSLLYSQVIKPSCRSCHNTRDGRISWDTWDGPGASDGFKENRLIEPWVCGPSPIMPNAKVTYENFWLSTAPHRPTALANGGIDGWAPGRSVSGAVSEINQRFERTGGNHVEPHRIRCRRKGAPRRGQSEERPARAHQGAGEPLRQGVRRRHRLSQ